jgi:NCS1 family nucleobase:cation symporter-1
VTRYEAFLLLIGSVFVPLFGVLAIDYFVLRGGRYAPGAVLAAAGAGGVVPGVRWRGVVAWAMGVVSYLWIAGRLEALGLPGMSAVGASLPSLAAAALSYGVLSRDRTRG